MTNLSKFYQDSIIKHSSNQAHFGVLKEFTHKCEGYNRVCGDDLHIYLNVVDNQIKDISFDGQACAICKASASLMCEKLRHTELVDALLFKKKFDQLLEDFNEKEELGDLNLFAELQHLKSRIKCAQLPWQAFKGAIESVKEVTTE